MHENGYEGMPPVQEMIPAYLSVADILSQSSLRPSKPLNLA